jgi:RNA 3'-terminal phosphate cyclase (ATP)
MIEIDGSMGEGGGQILRSALALSVITGTPFRISNIRANRKPKPGLRRQHVTAVRSAAEISGAEVEGDIVESRELTFRPGALKPGDYTFDIGSAGSTTLVLQTVLPPLLTANAPSTLVLEGGTHNPGAPPADFLERVFLPIANRMGPRVHVAVERPGFAPKGGGRVIVTIEPVKSLKPVELLDRGRVLRRRATAVVAGLPRTIAERELKVVAERGGWAADELHVEQLPDAFGPGNILLLEVESEHVTEVFSHVGQHGLRAERLAETAVNDAMRYLDANVPVGDCLADQLLLPLALAGGGAYRTLGLTQHAETNIEVIRMFLDVTIRAEASEADAVRIDVGDI